MSEVLFRVSRGLLRGLDGKYPMKSNILLTSRSFHLGKATMVRFITQSEALSIDEELFNTHKFSIEQLMELAGLASACAIYKCYSFERHPTIIVLCGPGNNGGDGLVCARHLKHFGFNPEIYYPRQNLAPHFKKLVEQCHAMEIKFHHMMPNINLFSMAIDALFGFSFKPPIRAEFQPIVDQFYDTKTTLCSIDIPSGWDVDLGRIKGLKGFTPDLLISLTAPKLGARHFGGKYHFLGGRFVPPKLATSFNLRLPKFHNADCCVDITGWEDLPEGPAFND